MRLRQAFSILSDRELRKFYDEELQGAKRGKRAERTRHATTLWGRARRQQHPESPCSRGTTRGKATRNKTTREKNSATVVQERAPCQNP